MAVAGKPNDQEVGSSDDAVEAGSSPLITPDQIRIAIRKMDELNDKFEKLNKAPTFRTADVANLAAIGIALIVAIFTALGLSSRIEDLKGRQSDMERRIDGRIDGAETKLGGKIDHLDDKFMNADERLSRIEGKPK